MAKSPFTPEQRAMIAQEYLDEVESSITLAAKYGVHPATIRIWAHHFQEQGIAAFKREAGNSSYSAELKQECVNCYLRGEMSMDEIAIHYNISNRGVVCHWIKKYNANEEFRDYDPKREVYMAEARRKTTREERLEIVRYCLDHDRDYKGTASLYNVSYSQVYSWVKKFNADGEDGLTDRRGRHKTDDEVDELERLRRENLRLKQQLKERDMTVELLKKVKEFERK